MTSSTEGLLREPYDAEVREYGVHFDERLWSEKQWSMRGSIDLSD